MDTEGSEDGVVAGCSLLLLLKGEHHHPARGTPPEAGLEAGRWAPPLALPPALLRVGVGTSSRGREGVLPANCTAAWAGQSWVGTVCGRPPPPGQGCEALRGHPEKRGEM